MISKNYQFWFSYCAAWLLYAMSLMVVGAWRREFQISGYEFLSILGNVVPGAVLGILVIKLCDKLKWSNEKTAKFIIIHVLLAALFAALWCAIVVVDSSILTFVANGRTWKIIWMTSFILNVQFFLGLMAYLTIASAVYVRQVNE